MFLNMPIKGTDLHFHPLLKLESIQWFCSDQDSSSLASINYIGFGAFQILGVRKSILVLWILPACTLVPSANEMPHSSQYSLFFCCFEQ